MTDIQQPTKENKIEKQISQIEQKKKVSHSVSSSQSVKSRHHKDKKKKKNHDRSRSKKRSRSRDKKKKHKSSRHHSREKYDSHKSRSNDRNNKFRDNDHRQRGRSRQKNNNKTTDVNIPKEVPMPLQIPMPPIPGQRRKRQRSRSPLGYYRRNQNNNDGQFWDSFAWVPRINYTPNVSSSALVNTKKMRRLMITNIPYQIGITQDDLRDLITRFMKENYLKDQMNTCPVVNLQINQTDRNVAVELSSVEETCRICKLDKIELFKGVNNGIVRLGDSMYGNNVITQAQNAAKAQATAFAAINILENKKTNFTLATSNSTKSSTVLRITNAVTLYMCSYLTPQQWQDYRQDLIEGLSEFGTIVHSWFVKKEQKDICADAGNLFIQFECLQQAEAAMAQMDGRIYDQRKIKIFYVPRQLYYQNFQKDIKPPTILTSKPKPKIQK